MQNQPLETNIYASQKHKLENRINGNYSKNTQYSNLVFRYFHSKTI